MRTIIAGSRTIIDHNILSNVVSKCGWHITTVLTGLAHGVDFLGVMWAIDNGIKLEKYPANWKEYGISAGYKRNLQMAIKAEALIAIWDGKSRGTRHMIELAGEYLLKIHVEVII